MEIFESRYYNINRIQLMMIGLWPYTSMKYIARVFNMGGLFILLIPQLISAVVNHKDVDRLFLSILCFCAGFVMFLKVFTLSISERNMMKVFGLIADNWLLIQDEDEREILIKYSERARFFTLLYGANMWSAGLLLAMVPYGPLVVRLLYPDKHINNIFILAGEYFVDRNLYPTTFAFLDMVLVLLVTSVTVGADSMYISCGEHISAMNAIISYRLKNLKNEAEDLPGSKKGSYAKLISIIELHQRTISFVSTMSDTYSLTFLMIMGLFVITIPTNACAILANLDRPVMLTEYSLILFAMLFHDVVLVVPGQRILDHFANLSVDAYNNQWYDLPLASKKLLAIFMLRCSEPTYLTAGGLLLINLETFSRIMRTAVSYITVLASFR